MYTEFLYCKHIDLLNNKHEKINTKSDAVLDKHLVSVESLQHSGAWNSLTEL